MKLDCAHSGFDCNFVPIELEFNGETIDDGNCLFHAVADQLNMQNLADLNHTDLRKALAQFLHDNPNLKVCH